MKGDDRQRRLTETNYHLHCLRFAKPATENDRERGTYKNHNAELIRDIPRCL